MARPIPQNPKGKTLQHPNSTPAKRRVITPIHVDGRLKLPLLEPGQQLASITADFLQIARSAHSRLILVSSAKAGEGKTNSTLNFARGLVHEAGLKVLVVDLNPDNPTLGERLGCENAIGLTDLLAGRADIEKVLHHSDATGIDFLSFGMPMAGRLQLFTGTTGNNLFTVLQRLSTVYDYVLCDGPAVFGASDPSVIAPRMGGVIMVAASEQTRSEVFVAAEARLRESGAQPLGVVLNRRRYHVPKSFYGN